MPYLRWNTNLHRSRWMMMKDKYNAHRNQKLMNVTYQIYLRNQAEQLLAIFQGQGLCVVRNMRRFIRHMCNSANNRCAGALYAAHGRGCTGCMQLPWAGRRGPGVPGLWSCKKSEGTVRAPIKLAQCTLGFMHRAPASASRVGYASNVHASKLVFTAIIAFKKR